MVLRRWILFLSVALAVAAGLALPAVAGTERGILAVLFMGAAGTAVSAHTTPSKSAPTADKTPQPLPVAADEAVEKQTPQRKEVKEVAAEKTDVRTYAVKPGDYLSRIADEQDVSGGWERLYADNREAIGADPSLIRPGLKLVIGGKQAEAAALESSAADSFTYQRSGTKRAGTTAPARKRAGTVVPESSPVASTPRSQSPSKDSSDPKHSESKTARKATTAFKATGSVNGFTAPVTGAPLGTGYKTGGSLWSSGHHTGVDFLAAAGTPLKAVGAGTVVSADWSDAYGNQVVIQLADGYYAQYAHLSALSVASGQAVTAGQQIGLSGATGNVTGPHLHFEIRTTPDYGSDIDPVAYLRTKGVSIG
ncbi:murein DD-endopeptidase MepM/ murein hydrolase activator NlpD [Streptomyces sp. SAI-135]|uniref:M23 family metallopeptidase n=1 Tax=unclassified Streptomyces TaxID=2593676 RepID=UPI002474A18F|nr:MULTISPECIES: M23 family metallopeptidase [unclassified Streptomyces]MDH6522976.1 murein DD-endopeptidase MepM/ murein hydrolase activator NlpD [Streptomyces sp. SAI-090]MDH6554595.1 murein DD-endopeptidase MepM/ murein hydrolase activator NlpD [Streptomyces sp. SAI-041]MDH6613411.1 murein DD-endopeptidase MepM/ murein hydrolase activator NlpD [Streptomyces sp. SAI-135]